MFNTQMRDQLEMLLDPLIGPCLVLEIKHGQLVVSECQRPVFRGYEKLVDAIRKTMGDVQAARRRLNDDCYDVLGDKADEAVARDLAIVNG